MTQGKPEERVSIVGGDRLCVRCGFNLIGQPVLREPVYGMLMVRCPECATPAALQEYPVLGRWANRWAALLAALWLFVLIALLAATAGMSGGFGAGATEVSATRLGDVIGKAHDAWLKGLDETARKALPQWVVQQGGQVSGAYTWLDVKWWSQQDPAAMVAAAGGWVRAVDRSVLAMWVAVFFAGLAAGAVWSVALLGARRKRVALVVVLPVAIASVVAFSFWFSDVGPSRPFGMITGQSAASEILGPWVFGATMLVMLGSMWVGVWIGRPLARALVRALLPPRAANALSTLWISEGKEPPRVTPRPSGPR